MVLDGEAGAGRRRAGGCRRCTRRRGAARLLAVGAAGWWWYGRAALSEARARHSREPSVAVLPFANLGGEAEDYFADGITEDLITDLAKVSGLVVIARNSAFTYKGRSVAVQQVAASSASATWSKGSVRRAGNRIRINAQLIDGDDRRAISGRTGSTASSPTSSPSRTR